jgi:hypothetical protein
MVIQLLIFVIKFREEILILFYLFGFILNLAPQVSARLAQCYFNYKPDFPVGGVPR